MIPRTYLSTFASNGQQQMRVYFLNSVAGLTRWADYIPVKLTQGGKENSYDNNGFIDVEVVGRSATAVPFKDYVPVYADSSASDAWQVNATGYIPYGYAGFGDAALVLDFTSPAALDPRITFTRASTATYFNSAGVLTTTGFNLLTYSEQFDNAAWSKSNATITANTIVSPDGALTGDKLVEDTANSTHLVQRNATVTFTAAAHTWSVYLKAAERTWTRLTMLDGVSTFGAYFDLSTGAIGATSAGATASVTSVGNGWYRCSVTATTAATASGSTRILLANADNGQTYTGNGTSGIYIWGAQLEAGSAATVYIPTTSATSGAARFDYDPVTLAPKGLLIEESRTNLVTYSEQFDDAAWTKTRSSITANAIVSPDGTMDADKLVEDSTAANTHQIQRSISYTSGTTYTRSLYAKAAERTGFRFQFPSSAFTSGINAYFDLATGAVASVSAGVTATITPVGNGWYRCTATATATATASGTEISCGLTITASNPTYTGDGTSGLFIWGAQLEAGAFATSYIPTVASQVTRAADVAVMTGTNFSSWYNATEGTLLVDFAWEGLRLIAGQRIIALDDGTNTTYWGMTATGANGMQNPVVISGATDATNSTPSTTYTVSTPYKQAVALALNNSVGAINGIAGTTDTAVGVPSGLTTARFAATALGGTISNIWFRRIAYYNRRLTNAELQGITS